MADYSQATDQELIAACRQGKAVAWDALVSRYERLVYTIPIRYGLPRSEADDVFQIVWTRLVEHLPTLNQPDRISAWLVTTARRECWNRRRGADYERSTSVAPEMLPADSWTEELSPEDIIARYEGYTSLQNALNVMKERCRQLLWHLYQDPAQLPYAEIAENLNMKVGAIGPTRARCLKKLRELLAK